MSYENDPDVAAFGVTKKKAAADLNNPSGLGYNGQTWTSYDTPEQGVQDTLRLVQKKLKTKGLNNPESFVGNWVTGDPSKGGAVTSGNYVKSLKNELIQNGIQLNPDGTIPDTSEAAHAITRALIKNETSPDKQQQFLKYVDPKNPYSTDPDVGAFQVVTPEEKVEKPYQPGYYNPNLQRQVAKARVNMPGAAAVEQFGKDVTQPIAEMDFAKESSLPSVGKYALGSMPIVGTGREAQTAEAQAELQRRLLKGVEGVKSFVQSPIESLQGVYEGLKNARPGQIVGGAIKSTLLEPELALLPVKPVLSGIGKTVEAAGKVVAPVVQGAKEGFGTLQDVFQATRQGAKPSMISPVPSTTAGANVFRTEEKIQQLRQKADELNKDVINPDSGLEGQELLKRADAVRSMRAEASRLENTIKSSMVGGGAALTEQTNAVKAALQNVHPEVVQDLLRQAGVRSIDELPFDRVNLQALDTHQKFNKFGMMATEGEALGDIAKMSDEWNNRAKNPELLKRFEERNPKLVAAVNDIQERAAPDIYTKDIKELGQLAIDDLVKKDAVRLANIENNYKALEAANGGQFPIDVNQLGANIDKSLKSKLKSKYYETQLSEVKHEIDNFIKQGSMTFEDFENLRTNLAQEMRSSKNGNVRAAAHIIREQLENLPMPDNLASIKPLADKARASVVERNKILESNPAYRAATKDTRNIAELQSGVDHVGSDRFISKFVTGNTDTASRANIQRLIQELGEDSQGHQAIKSGTIEHLKQLGVNQQGVFKQDAFGKNVKTVLGSKLDSIMQKPFVTDLNDLADVARMSEHVKGGPSFANTSNTAVVSERNAMLKEAKNIGAGVAEAAINTQTKGFGGTLLRRQLEARAEKKAAEQAAKQAALETQRILSPSAGVLLKDIGK